MRMLTMSLLICAPHVRGPDMEGITGSLLIVEWGDEEESSGARVYMKNLPHLIILDDRVGDESIFPSIRIRGLEHEWSLIDGLSWSLSFRSI